jgi:FG-GAP repeat
MRRIAVVVVLVLVAAVWPLAGLGAGAQAAPAVITASLQADFNNDGADDLAVGVPTESVGSISRAGAVSVLYGSAGGLTGTGSQLVTQDTPGVLGSPEAGDNFGVAVASGDFNDDGFADLAVGADLEDAAAVADAGVVSVLYGSASGLTGTGSQLFTQVAGAAEAGDRFGAALAAGDFNNDGFAELAAGAPLEDVGGTVDAGAVSVLYGSAGGLTGTGSQLFPQVAGAIEAGDRFGAALATGDFNNDGFAELAAGAPFEDVATTADAGVVLMLFSSADGLTGGARTFTQVAGAIEARDRFGAALAAGDFNNDGFPDLAASAPLEDVGTTVDAGAVSEIPGSASWLTTSGGQLHTERSFTGPQANDQFGFALASGDFGNDGFADLAVGIPGENIEPPVISVPDIGAVNVFFGFPDGLFATFEDQHLQPSNPERGDRFGMAVAAGDFNNDDSADLAVGAPLEDVGGAVDAGAFTVLHGPVIGISSDTFTQDSPGVAGSAEAGDHFGAALTVGDSPGP